MSPGRSDPVRPQAFPCFFVDGKDKNPGEIYGVMQEKNTMAGQNALVTGASSGIGRATAERFAAAGVNVALAARSTDTLSELTQRLEERHGVHAPVVPVDIRREEDVANMVKKTMEAFETLDVVVNNAGVIRYGDIERFSTEDYRAVMETNVDGVFFTTRAVLPHLRESKGNLVFVGSFDANHPRSFNPIYAASKWWVKGFAHSIAAVAGTDGVAVTLVNPSEVRTAIPDSDGVSYSEKFAPDEVTSPEAVAEAILFAARQEPPTTLSQIDIYRRDKLSEFF